jgi:hypothetical protein
MIVHHLGIFLYSIQGDPMRCDSDFRLLFEGSPVAIVLAELFLRAEGFHVYAMRFDPMASIVSAHWGLYVAREDHQDALEVLVFLGFVDGFYFLNAMSVMLRRDLHDLLPADQLASIQKWGALLQAQDVEQAVVVLGVSLTMGAALACEVFGFGTGAVIAPVIALMGMIPFWQSEKLQRDFRSRLRAEALPRAEDVVEWAQPKLCEYAVFLRNFDVLREFLVSPEVNPGLRVDPYESRIVEAIRYGACMPVVALTDPKTRAEPIVGACRFAVHSDTGWLEFGGEILKGASLIVVHIRKMTPPLQSEVEIIQKGGLMSRTILLVDKESPEIPINLTVAADEGAKVLSLAVFEEWGLSDFIEEVEDIRVVSTESGRGALESDLHDDRSFCSDCGGVVRPNGNSSIHCRRKVLESLESIEDNDGSVPLDHWGREELQDTLPTVAATCPTCGHTWMGSWHVRFKDRQCPQCGGDGKYCLIKQ